MPKIKKKKILPRRKHRTWQLQEAKSRFSELVNDVIKDGYQTITKNGEPVAVLVSKKEFDRFQTPKNSLIDFFLEAPFPEEDLDIERNKDIGREIDL